MKVISLFAGAGGLDLGLEHAGFDVAVAVERDETAVKTLNANRHKWEVLQSDIHGVKSKNLLEKANLKVGQASLLAGGPPCQPFSKSGFWAKGDVDRLGDPRASTVEEFLRVLADTRPMVYLLENVPGIGYRNKDEGLQLFRERIEAINRESGHGKKRVNYSCEVDVLDALDYGVPQRRSRLFIVGHREGIEFKFPKPTHAALPESGQENLDSILEYQRNAWDAIGQWEDDDDPELQLKGKWAGLLPSIPEGQNYLYLTDRGGGEPLFGWRTRYWSFLLKLAKHLPSWTLTAQPGPATGPFHWKNRRLSIRELCALQTFPADYSIAGGLRAGQVQVGNAVPSALAELLGLHIRKQLLEEDKLDVASRSLVPARRPGLPKPDDPVPVPGAYQGLIRNRAPHPGPGLGPGARRRGAQS